MVIRRAAFGGPVVQSRRAGVRPYRKERVASVVHEIVSDAIANRLQDPRIATLTTVTRVEVSGDLQIAKVFLSVPGEEADERRTLQAVRHAGGYIQRLVAQELSVRQCPELRFALDLGAKEARRTLELLAENRQRDPGLTAEVSDVDEEGDAPVSGPETERP
jgi:ribosome-binding factor A